MVVSKSGWERRIRSLAKTSGAIFWTEHAKQQMRKRAITMAVVLDALQNGAISREPELNIRTGRTECRMERYCAGRPVAVVVALEHVRASECIVVTAFMIGD